MGEARPKVHQIFAKNFCEFLLGIFMAVFLWRYNKGVFFMAFYIFLGSCDS